MNQEIQHRSALGVLTRGLTVAGLGIIIAVGSAAIGLTAAGWAAPLLVVVIGVCVLWFLLERAEQRRRKELRELARVALDMGAGGVEPDSGHAIEGLADAIERIRTRGRLIDAEFSALVQAAGSARDMLGAIDEPVIATERGRVVQCNDASLSILAEHGAGVVGRRLEDLLAQPELLALHAEASEGRTRRVRSRLVIEGMTRWYDVSAAPLPSREEGGAGVGGVLLCLRDVTELATAVQLKADFAANASHELRTPIASIRAAVETMSRGGDRDEAMRDRLRSMIEANVTRLEDLVSDLLDLSRLESPDLEARDEPVDLGALVESLAETFADACAARDLRIEVDIAPEAQRVECDAKHLELIVRNLVENATKFAFEGTPIVVRARPLNADGGGITLSVIDRGIGIPLPHQQRIFERFYQVDQARQGGSERRGTGLGLAIVKHAARRLGGSVRVESVWQEGTSMIVELPGVRAGASAP